MKTTRMLGLAVAFGVSAALTPQASHQESHFHATVRGAISADPTGAVAHGPVAVGGEEAGRFSIALGAQGSAGAILFTLPGDTVPGPGRYPIADDDAKPGPALRAVFIAGDGTRAAGVFRGQVGTLEITTSSANRLAGRFDFSATGFLAERPEDEQRTISVTGMFSTARSIPASRVYHP